MNTIILGNSGSGKSTLARALSPARSACLPLDEVAFREGAERHPLTASIAAVEQFMAQHSSWVIEGCYADIIEPVLGRCTRLIFLNPGTETCIAHCQTRPWEPEKYASKALQDEHLLALLDWVRQYVLREDEYGLAAHRRVFDGYQGDKHELTDPGAYLQALTP